MYERRFAVWVSWKKIDKLRHCECPGVYVISRCKSNLDGRRFTWRKDIIYIGMANSVGLKDRLRQFDDTISWRKGRSLHGGADRVRYCYRSYGSLSRHLYVAVARFKFDPNSNRHSDLRKWGNVLRFEYLCFAEYVERFDVLPPFNDRATLKFSRKVVEGR